MNKNELISRKSTELTTDTTNFENYLTSLGLPAENIIASIAERKRIETNLPEFIMSLDTETKREARYLSKFVAGAAIGLFDASLNYLWNEVVINLRKKVVIYGLDLFYDAAVGGAKRALFQTEDDLSGIKDEVLVNTCKKIEIISDIVASKLHHIQTMRNDIGASHPSTYSINAFDLLAWLQTCVQDVLNEKPSEAAIQIKVFFDNLIKTTTVIDSQTVRSMEKPISELSQRNADNLLNSIFYVYISDKSNNIIRKNISLLSKKIWDSCSENIKYKLGLNLDGYKNNLHKDKHELGLEFFNTCDGNRYQSLETRIFQIDELTDSLLEAHYVWDNYFNEPPFIEKILTFIKSEGDIPNQIADKLIQVILICRLGKGISYKNGVSPAGQLYYDTFFNLLGDDKIVTTIVQLHSEEIRFRLDNKICQKQLISILSIFIKNARSAKLKEILEYLIKHVDKFPTIHHLREYQILTKTHLVWK